MTGMKSKNVYRLSKICLFKFESVAFIHKSPLKVYFFGEWSWLVSYLSIIIIEAIIVLI